MDFKDYYSILGLQKTASQDEIKKAYRKLAQQYHPDKNPGDASAEAKFKEINEANQVLSDPQNRAKYDKLGSSWNNYRQNPGTNPQDFNWQAWQQQSRQGNGAQQDFSSMFGGSQGGFSDFFESIFNANSTQKKASGPVPKARKNITTAEISITLEQAYKGCSLNVNTQGINREVKLKPGIKHGQKLNIPSKQGPDLHITVSIKPDERFTINDTNLEANISVDLYIAMLGGEVNVQTLKGTVSVKIPPESLQGSKLRLKNLGMPVHGSENSFGDLILSLQIVLPQHLSEQEKDLFRSLAEYRK